jgi:hypothetical protein
MISHKSIAENIARLTFSRDKDDTCISMSNDVFDGVRYISFTGMDSSTFRESYTWATFMSDMLGMNERKETWRNPHFNIDWESIKPHLMNAIDDDEKTPVVLSGHGVGGAIALIAGYYLTMHHKNLLSVVTFGAPVALNYKKLKNGFMWPLHIITDQYVLKNDPLPKMFRWTKYWSANRTELDMRGGSCGINCYVDAMNIDDVGLL